jgi:SAM-dependent methyltransferase
MSSPLTDIVAQQYERWVYPQPIEDLEEAAKAGRTLMDPSVHHLAFWPERDYPKAMDILVAGCGAYEAAMLAFHNRDASVIGIDVSAASLGHEEKLKKKHKLDNLELRRLPIEEAGTLAKRFDLITAGGVLHHMADPQGGLRALAALLKPDGALPIMLYAKHGRVGIEMLRELFQNLGLKQDARSVAVVRDVLRALPASHPAAVARAAANDMAYDAGIVDLFLHQREQSYTVEDCIGFCEGAGLAFQDWLTNTLYYPESAFPPGSPPYAAINALPEREIWAAMELVHSLANARHHFVARRPDPKRPVIDFTGPAWQQYVPHLTYGASYQGGIIQRAGHRVPLPGTAGAAASQIDGHKTIAAILQAAVAETAQGRQLFLSLWRLGFIRVRIPGAV